MPHLRTLTVKLALRQPKLELVQSTLGLPLHAKRPAIQIEDLVRNIIGMQDVVVWSQRVVGQPSGFVFSSSQTIRAYQVNQRIVEVNVGRVEKLKCVSTLFAVPNVLGWG